MKKIFSLLLVVIMVLAFCACSSNVVKNRKPQANRTICIFDVANSQDNTRFDYFYDMDSDGNQEKIEVEVVGDSEPSILRVKIGDYNREFDTENCGILTAYICDIDVNDGISDLAVMTDESHAYTELKILSYAPELPSYRFSVNGEELDCLPYSHSRFNVHNDDAITVMTMTSIPTASWDVLKTYALSENGVFNEIKPEKYEIQHDFNAENYTDWYNSMRDIHFGEDLNEKDIEMLKKGYIVAHSDLLTESIEIRKGEYFKAPYDNGIDKVYIEKENGEAGWVLYDSSKFGVLNQYFFQTWGF